MAILKCSTVNFVSGSITPSGVCKNVTGLSAAYTVRIFPAVTHDTRCKSVNALDANENLEALCRERMLTKDLWL